MASIVGKLSGAWVPGHAQTGFEHGRILATIWIPGANPFNVVRGARGSLWLRSLASRGTGSGSRRRHDGGRGLPLRIEIDHFRGSRKFVAVLLPNRVRRLLLR